MDLSSYLFGVASAAVGIGGLALAIRKSRPELKLTLNEGEGDWAPFWIGPSAPPPPEPKPAVIMTAANVCDRQITIRHWEIIDPRGRPLELRGYSFSDAAIEPWKDYKLRPNAADVARDLRERGFRRTAKIRGQVTDAVGNKYRSPRYRFPDRQVRAGGVVASQRLPTGGREPVTRATARRSNRQFSFRCYVRPIPGFREKLPLGRPWRDSNGTRSNAKDRYRSSSSAAGTTTYLAGLRHVLTNAAMLPGQPR